ncbi:hypothetical protein CPC08DRAFT_151263 [Agrocybe pediades]|nr:hypothetical protein CPC08DRAFT_151263 [Agrocybe pediades]
MAKLYCNSLLVSLNNRLGGVTNIPGRDAKSATSIRFSVLAPRTNSTGIDIENSAVPSAQDEAMTQVRAHSVPCAIMLFCADFYNNRKRRNVFYNLVPKIRQKVHNIIYSRGMK